MKLKLFDNTRISSHRTCDCMYYWRHKRHLTGKGKAPPLVFGSCWHEAMDVVWRGIKDAPHLSNDELREVSYEAFKEAWSKFDLPPADNLDEDTISHFKARVPDTAFFMLGNYIEKRRSFIESVELLAIEKPFAVPIFPNNPDILYVGRRDKDIKWNGRIWAVEHKTSAWGSAKSGFSSTYIETFSPNSQIDGYLHSLKMEYGEVAKGVLVDMALVTMNNHEHFMFLPIERSIASLDAWLWKTRKEIQLMDINEEALARVDPSASYMDAYAQNDTSCIQFMKPCTYLDLCKTIPNPQARPDEIPLGFVERKWEPFDELKLDTIGLKKGEEDAKK